MSKRKQRQRRRKLITGAVIAAALIVVLGGAVWTSGVLSADRNAKSCVIADLSKSTQKARPRYVGEFERFATDAGTQTSGDLCLIMAAGDPLAEGAPLMTNVGPSGPRDAPTAKAEIASNVALASRQYEALLRNPPIETGGSELVEAAVVAADQLEPGDRLIYLSDGLQNSPATGQIKKLDLSPTEIDKLLDRLDAAGLLADLDGVQIEFPLMLYKPDGINVRSSRAIGVRNFWQAWAERTGAELSTGEGE